MEECRNAEKNMIMIQKAQQLKKKVRHLNGCKSPEWTADKTSDKLAVYKDLQANMFHSKYNIHNYKQCLYQNLNYHILEKQVKSDVNQKAKSFPFNV